MARVSQSRFFSSLLFAFYYTTVYTESLFVLEVVSAIWFARRKRWWLAAVSAGFSSATRLVGVAVIAGVLWSAFRYGSAGQVDSTGTDRYQWHGDLFWSALGEI